MTYATRFTVADLNGDGKPDLVGADNFAGIVSVLLNQGNGTFTSFELLEYVAGLGSVSIAAVDLNADGRPDLAVANREGNNVSVLLNTCIP